MGVYLNDAELEAMGRASPEARCAYVWLRWRMDWRTGLVGRVTSISYWAVGEWLEYDVPKGRGAVQVRLADTTQKIKDAALRLTEQLMRLGLLVKKAAPVLTFFCPMATLAESRPNQTNHKRTTPLSTEQTTGGMPSNPLSGAELSCFEGFEQAIPQNAGNGPNEPHIIGHGNTSTPQSPSTDLTGVDAGGGAAPGGPYRDRPAASQAGSLGRPGNPNETSDRDRPAGSHPAPAGRLGDGADAWCGRLHAGSSDTPGGLAESESAPLDDRPAAETALLAVLSRRGVRVPRPAAGGSDVVSIWAAEGVTPLELDGAIDEALDWRAKFESMQPVTVGYVAPIIQTRRSKARRAAAEARKAAADGGKRPARDQDFEALARSLGMYPAWLGESWEKWRARVYAAADASVSATVLRSGEVVPRGDGAVGGDGA